MGPMLIAIFLVIFFALIVKGGERVLARNKKSVDWHHVREMEAESGIYPLSELQCGPNCKKCKNGVASPGMQELYAKAQLKRPPPPSAGGATKARDKACKFCGKATFSSDVCQSCLLNQLQENKRKLEAEKRKHDAKRQRRVGDIVLNIPPHVPDDAFVFMSYNPTLMCDVADWKWTDKNTGQTRGLRQMIADIERFEVKTWDGRVVKKFATYDMGPN